jgi:hypothetical protein
MGRFLRMLLAAAGILAVGTTVAWATGLTSLGFVGNDGSITACATNSNGSVRFIDPSSTTKGLSSCKSGESTVVFNQKGQTGDTGPQGPRGPSAAFDQSGPTGVPIPESQDPDPSNPTKTTVARMDLPAGNFAVTAKAEFHNPSNVATVVIGCWFGDGDGGKITLAPGGVGIMPFVGMYGSNAPSESDLQCASFGGDAVLNNFHSVAIQVASVTITQN